MRVRALRAFGGNGFRCDVGAEFELPAIGGDWIQAGLVEVIDAPDYSKMTVKELRQVADERGIATAGLKKAELIEALN